VFQIKAQQCQWVRIMKTGIFLTAHCSQSIAFDVKSMLMILVTLVSKVSN